MTASTAVWAATVASGCLVAQHVAGKAARDALLLAHFGLELLPAAMIGAAALSAIAVLGISRWLGVSGPARVVPALIAGSAALFVVELLISLGSERAAAVALYAHVAILGSAAVSAFWSLVNERFDPHRARRVVARIASGGALGGVLGGAVVWQAAARLSLPGMLALLAGINLAALAAVRVVARGVPPGGQADQPTAGGGWGVMRDTPYLRDLALVVLVGAMIQALLDWLLSAHASQRFGTGAELLGFFALFNTVAGVLTFVAQATVARPLLERRGLADTALVHPITVALGAALALVVPQLWTVLLLRGGDAVTRNALQRTAYELFYTPLPTAKKRATKTVIDVGIDRAGTALAALGILAVVRLAPEGALRIVIVVTMVLAGLAWLVTAQLQRGYVSALAASLRSGAIALGPEDTHDRTTRSTLAETTALLDREELLARIEQLEASRRRVEAEASPAEPLLARAAELQSGDPARIKAALSEPLPTSLVPLAIPLLSDDAVVRDVARALRRIAPVVVTQLLDALRDQDVDPRARRRIPRLLRRGRGEGVSSGLRSALRDPAFGVRVEAALALEQERGEGQVVLAPEDAFDIAIRELTSGPFAAATPVDDPDRRRHLAHVFTVLGLVLEPESLGDARRAMRSEDPRLRGTAYEYLEASLPSRVCEVLLPQLGWGPEDRPA
jgi:hypothetical protein